MEPVPAEDITRQSDLARYILRLADAGEDCRERLRGLNELIQDWQKAANTTG